MVIVRFGENLIQKLNHQNGLFGLILKNMVGVKKWRVIYND
jgi:hypothetical protein